MIIEAEGEGFLVHEIIIIPSGTVTEELISAFRFRYDIYVNELAYIKTQYIYELLKMEFDAYDKNSTHFMIKRDSEVIAYARIIADGEEGLPVLNKVGFSNIFTGKKKVEVSRMIIDKEYRLTKVIKDLYKNIFRYLSELDRGTVILADVFVNSNSYKGLKYIGFQESDLRYHDDSFLLDEESVLLYMNTENVKNMLF